MAGELLRNDYYILRWESGERFARLKRTSTPFADLALMERVNAEAAAALQASGARRLLMDLREGPPGRNDAPFEQASAHWRRELARLERRAVVVRTAVGRLQVNRLSKGATNTHVTQDEADAIAYLTSP